MRTIYLRWHFCHLGGSLGRCSGLDLGGQEVGVPQTAGIPSSGVVVSRILPGPTVSSPATTLPSTPRNLTESSSPPGLRPPSALIRGLLDSLVPACDPRVHTALQLPSNWAHFN